MTRIANRSGREYRSQLRAEQAAETGKRILDATVRLSASGIASLSIPAVAREAGVSVPTVYRHFATKRDLLAEVYPHVVREAGLDQLVAPRSMEELLDGLRTHFERTDSLGDLARLAIFRRVADSIVPRPSTADRDRIARLLVILTASSALRLWRDQLGSSVEEVADDVDWVIRAAIASASSRDR